MVFILRKFQAHPQASRAVPSAGGYGPYTADSAVLAEHLERLRQQQAVVLELIAAQHQNPDHHPHEHPLVPDMAAPAQRQSAARAHGSAAGLGDLARYHGGRRSSADVAHLPPPVPRRVSHAGAVVAVAPEGAGYPAERSQQEPSQPALRPKVFRELRRLLSALCRNKAVVMALFVCSLLWHPLSSLSGWAQALCADFGANEDVACTCHGNAAHKHAQQGMSCASDVQHRAPANFGTMLRTTCGSILTQKAHPDTPCRVQNAAKEEALQRTEMPLWRAPVTEADIAANLRFHPIQPKIPALRRRSHWYPAGLATFACWLGAFGFYLYVRMGRTMDSHSNIFAYQVRHHTCVVLVPVSHQLTVVNWLLLETSVLGTAACCYDTRCA